MDEKYIDTHTPPGNSKSGFYFEMNIKHKRINANKTQKEIAAFLNITPQQYNLYEQGKREIPLHLLVALSVYYHVEIDELIIIPERPSISKEGIVTRTNVMIREADRELSPFEKGVFGSLTTIQCPDCRSPMFDFLHGAEGLYKTTCPNCKKSFHLMLQAKRN